MTNSNSAMATIINLFRIVAVSFICCCTVTVSQTIASTSNATHTVYDTSQSEEFRDNSFYCNTSYCTIICDTKEGCRGAEIVVNNSISANIVCSGDMSCYTSVLQIVDTENVEIECTGSGSSCFYMEITIHNSTTANIACPGSSSCDSMDAYISDTATLSISCTLCSRSDFSVNNSNSFKMFCGDSNSDDLDDLGSCSGSKIDIVANEAEINALGTLAAYGMEVRAQWVQSRFVGLIHRLRYFQVSI